MFITWALKSLNGAFGENKQIIRIQKTVHKAQIIIIQLVKHVPESKPPAVLHTLLRFMPVLGTQGLNLLFHQFCAYFTQL